MKEKIFPLFPIFFFFSLLLFDPLVYGYAQEPDKNYKTILIQIHGREDSGDETLDMIIMESLALEFERIGLTPIESKSGDAREKAASENIDLVCLSSYATEGSLIEIEVLCSDVKTPDIQASVSKNGDLNLSLDELFSEAVQEVINKIKEQAPNVSITPPEKNTPARFTLSLGTAPFIAAGKVNYYFSIGSLTSLYGNYIVRTSFGDFGFGAVTGIHVFRAAGLITESNNLLLPFGADIHYGTSAEKTFSIFTRLSGGIALFIFRPAEDETLSKIITYLSGGAGTGLRFKNNFGISLDVSYFVFIEKYYPIMGFVPSLYINLWF